MSEVPADLLDALRAAIAPLDTPERRARYMAGEFPRDPNGQILSYRWDLFWSTWHSAVESDRAACRAIFDTPGVKDAHIDTALRAIVPPL